MKRNILEGIAAVRGPFAIALFKSWIPGPSKPTWTANAKELPRVVMQLREARPRYPTLEMDIGHNEEPPIGEHLMEVFAGTQVLYAGWCRFVGYTLTEEGYKVTVMIEDTGAPRLEDLEFKVPHKSGPIILDSYVYKRPKHWWQRLAPIDYVLILVWTLVVIASVLALGAALGFWSWL